MKIYCREKIFFTALLASLFLSGVSGCTYKKRELKKGQCRENVDCPRGTHCGDSGWCEDIYHPRRDIKNY